jgi:aldose 1-epimerase
MKKPFVILGGILIMASTVHGEVPEITKQPWGDVGGRAVDLYTLRNAKGSVVKISNYGGIVQSVCVPCKTGKLGDVVLGYDTLAGYVKETPYFGCLVGRYGNRIAKGRFTLDGRDYTLATNNGPNALHGGLKGFDKVVWDAKSSVMKAGPTLELHYVSPDGEEGYPGALDVTATYTWTDNNELRLEYRATTDKPTVVNLTQHSYFNLAGKGDVLGHVVMIKSDKITPVDSTLIPTGAFMPVKGTPFDFNKPTAIGERIAANHEQIKFGGGYDHNFVIAKGSGLGLMARVTEPATGRVLEVLSTEPALQFYSGNFLDGHLTGKNGWVYQQRNGFCMEPQHYPDSPNQPKFPTVVLRPGKTYKNTIVYRFGVTE